MSDQPMTPREALDFVEHVEKLLRVGGRRLISSVVKDSALPVLRECVERDEAAVSADRVLARESEWIAQSKVDGAEVARLRERLEEAECELSHEQTQRAADMAAYKTLLVAVGGVPAPKGDAPLPPLVAAQQAKADALAEAMKTLLDTLSRPFPVVGGEGRAVREEVAAHAERALRAFRGEGGGE